MSLLTLHKVLISFAIAFFLFFGISELTRSDGVNTPIIATICLALAIGGLTYLIWVFRGGYTRKN